MSNVTIWHNPRCSKSRQTLALLEEQGITPTQRLYLKDAPSKAEIRAAIKALDRPIMDIVRTGEADFKELNLSPIAYENSIIEALAKNPKLIERPIVFVDSRARIGRPPESVLELFKPQPSVREQGI